MKQRKRLTSKQSLEQRLSHTAFWASQSVINPYRNARVGSSKSIRVRKAPGRTLSNGRRQCSDAKSVHCSNSCPKYVRLSPFDLTTALVIILYTSSYESDSLNGRRLVRYYRGFPALPPDTIVAFIVEAPLSRTSIGSECMWFRQKLGLSSPYA